MIAFCGLDCEKCEAFIATAANDQSGRERIAAEWSKSFGTTLTAADINCTGCHGSGVKLAYCEHMCQIRTCAMGKALATCAGCTTYACDKLQAVFKAAPQAKAQLDLLRAP